MQQFFLNVRRQVQQIHDLRQARPTNVSYPEPVIIDGSPPSFYVHWLPFTEIEPPGKLDPKEAPPDSMPGIISTNGSVKICVRKMWKPFR